MANSRVGDRRYRVLVAGCILVAMAARAAAQEVAEDAAAPPPLPPKVQGEQLEPTVQIRRDEEDNLIEEYSSNGRVYMVKVTPKNGPAYYYLDEDGDGQLELREGDRAGNPVRPVYWKVKEW